MTIYEQLKGNGLIAFSDPAGAKACLSIANIVSRIAPHAVINLVSNKSYPFYTDWNLNVEIVDVIQNNITVGVDWVFTGTSHPESSERFELNYIRLAKLQNIPSFSFIDHWTLMALRFDDGVGNLILPDKIIVVDDYAKKLAIDEGLPAGKLEICNNPYHDYINGYWQPKMNNTEFRKLLKIDSKASIILYAPDPLTLRNEDKMFGFSEDFVLDEILQMVHPYNCHVIVKAHPLQPKDVLENVISNHPNAMVTYITNQIGNLDLIANSNIIIGFYSNFLIEAAALGKTIIRYFPHSKKRDPIEHLHIGELVGSQKSLIAALLPKIK